MVRPLKYSESTVDIKLTIPKNLRDKARAADMNISEFLTLKLKEEFKIDYLKKKS